MFEQLLEASFKGVTFRVREESLPASGRRTVPHEYPNSDERFVEDLGSIPAQFSIAAFVHGADWLEKAKALERVLSEPGAGRLSLPSFGVHTVWALPYKKSVKHEALGIVEFDLEFASGRPSSGPGIADPNIEDVFSAGDSTRASLQSGYAGLAGVPDLDAIGQQAVVSDLLNAVQDIGLLLGVVDPSVLADIQLLVGELTLSAPVLLTNPLQLAGKLFSNSELEPGLWSLVSIGSTVSSSATGSLHEALSFTRGFGRDLPIREDDIEAGRRIEPVPGTSLWPADTAQRIQRNQARQLFVDSQRIASLTVAFEAAASAAYGTRAEILSAIDALETAYSDVAYAPEGLATLQPVRDALRGVRLAALDVISAKLQSAYQVTSVAIPVAVSPLTLSYGLYAEQLTAPAAITDRAYVLRDLNPELPADALVGDVAVTVQG
ncbi:DNA circularization N-terminal domain-containing protein [Lysobacter sp. GCM10012299]|uniref:DNA circularization N-terminal domain-containing protein n=1 Tax=Lysobacter sp. GCM10012299 TaxID=3317333 RepID=UPI00360C21E7